MKNDSFKTHDKVLDNNSLQKVWPLLGGWAGLKHTEGWAGEGESVGKDLTMAPVLVCLLACVGSRWSLMFLGASGDLWTRAGGPRTCAHTSHSEIVLHYDFCLLTLTSELLH